MYIKDAPSASVGSKFLVTAPVRVLTKAFPPSGTAMVTLGPLSAAAEGVAADLSPQAVSMVVNNTNEVSMGPPGWGLS